MAIEKKKKKIRNALLPYIYITEFKLFQTDQCWDMLLLVLF